ncbi:AMP-binding protein [Nocardia sp. KC 131]|uniref:AMP-binding protein n=1 Tax=Nocardia arseniciresistens TaxID=3392119 RepID=UPI00398EB84F
MTGVGDDTVSEARANGTGQAPLALSTAQLRWWVAQPSHADVPITVAMYLDLSGPVDVELLRDCIARATRELQSPHLRFRIIDGQPHQYLDMREDLPFRIEDLTGQPDPVAAAVAHMEGDYTAALDLLSDKLTVVTVYRVAGERHLLYIRSHHIVVDGVGAAAVLRRTAQLYRAAVEKTQAEPAAARALSVAELLSDEQAYRDSPRPAVRPGVAPSVLLPELLRAGTLPDAVALGDGERTMTYRELDEASSRWARELMAGGAGPGEFVVVAVPRSLESVLALWAVAKSGACFVPVDPTEPAPRIATIIADSGARQGLTVATVRRNLPCSGGSARRNGVEHGAAATGSGDPVATDSRDADRRGAPGVPQRDTQRARRYVVPGGQRGIDWLVLDDPRAVSRIARRAATPVDNADRARALRPGHPAYLIYTSGTTGTPKGVAVTHRGLGPLTGYITEHYGVHQDSVVPHAHTPSFDAHLLELFAAFAVGALLVIEPPSVVVGDALAQLIEDSGITHFLTTPAVLATLSPTEVPGLEVVVVGGEACPSDLVRRWAPHVRLFNGYGPTETALRWSIADRLRRADAAVDASTDRRVRSPGEHTR